MTPHNQQFMLEFYNFFEDIHRKYCTSFVPWWLCWRCEVGSIMCKIILPYLYRPSQLEWGMSFIIHFIFYIECVRVCVYNIEWDNAKHTCAICCSFLVDSFLLWMLSCTVLRKTTNWFLLLYSLYKPLINPVTGLTTIAYLLFVWVFCFCFYGIFLLTDTWLKNVMFCGVFTATAAAASVSVFSQYHQHGGFSSII